MFLFHIFNLPKNKQIRDKMLISWHHAWSSDDILTVRKCRDKISKSTRHEPSHITALFRPKLVLQKKKKGNNADDTTTRRDVIRNSTSRYT